MTTITCFAIELSGQYYNRNMEVFTDLLHATLYEQKNPDDLKLFEKDKKQLQNLGFCIQDSRIKFGVEPKTS